MIIEGNNDNFEKEVLNGKVLVDFNATWCGPCRMLKPILEDLASTVNTKIVSIDVDNEDELAAKYNISSIPCLILFEDGKEVKRHIGLLSKDEVIEMIGDK